MSITIEHLTKILDLERLEGDRFRGQNLTFGISHIYGGQVLAQALMAAGRTVEETKLPHSLHGYFLLLGDLKAPVDYEVHRIRDGRSFTTRRVVASQKGHPIFNLAASFHVEEPGFEHQDEMPEVPPPENVISHEEIRKQMAQQASGRTRAFFLADRPVEVKFINPIDYITPQKRPPKRCMWFRMKGGLPNNQLLQKCLLAYASDYGILQTSLLPHGTTFLQPGMMVATLDHGLWFHRPFNCADWLLYCTESPSAFGARGFCRGSIFAKDGRLVASTVQEGLIREIRKGD